jgi:hypothetical protein
MQTQSGHPERSEGPHDRANTRDFMRDPHPRERFLAALGMTSRRAWRAQILMRTQVLSSIQPVILSEAKDPAIVQRDIQLECDADWYVRFLATLGMTNRARTARTIFQ